MKPKKETNPKRIVSVGVDKGKDSDITCTVVVEVKDGKSTVVSEDFKETRKGEQNR
jgi:phage FluMu gp28-like protein